MNISQPMTCPACGNTDLFLHTYYDPGCDSVDIRVMCPCGCWSPTFVHQTIAEVRRWWAANAHNWWKNEQAQRKEYGCSALERDRETALREYLRLADLCRNQLMEFEIKAAAHIKPAP